MIDKIVNKYIQNITLNDVLNFGISNNIILDNTEAEIVYYYIKKDWKLLLSDRYMEVLNNSKEELSEENFKKIENLIIFYRQKYKHYL